jgi:hypothetical protein
MLLPGGGGGRVRNRVEGSHSKYYIRRGAV